MKDEVLLASGRSPRWESQVLRKLVDVVIIVATLWIVCAVADRPWAVQMVPAATAIVVFQLAGEAMGLYRHGRIGILSAELARVGIVWLVVVFSLLLLGYGLKTSEQYSRIAIGAWFVVAPVVLWGWRVAARIVASRLSVRSADMRKVAIAGAGHGASEVGNVIEHSSWLGLRLAGCFDDRRQKPGRTRWPGLLDGSLSDLVSLARNNAIDVVFVTLPLKGAERIRALLDQLADTTVSVYIVPEAYWTQVLRGDWANLGNLPVVSVFETPFYGLSGWLKRLQDVALASAILLVVGIPMAIIAVAVKWSSPGPVLFKQRRYGLDGRDIDVWKFRTLRVSEDGSGVRQVQRNDPRVTAVGAFLRRTSLDELPQFFNVLQGSMSVVGPRPHAVVHNEHYRSLISGYMMRHKVKPGITGWAQVNGWRGETRTLDKMQHRVEHDLWYINNWSFWLDIKIIGLTMLKGFVGKNAF